MLFRHLTLLWKLRLSALFALLLLSFSVLAAESPWQQARIVDVKTTADTRTSTWIVNTPIQSEETVCMIRIHLKDKILQGIYTLDKSQAPPPPEWVKHAPIRAQIVGDRVFLKGPHGSDYKLRVVSAKSAPMLDPWTTQEVTAEKAAAMTEEADHSMIGFDDKPATPAKPAQAEHRLRRPRLRRLPRPSLQPGSSASVRCRILPRSSSTARAWATRPPS